MAEPQRIGARTAPIGVVLMVISSLFSCTGQFMWKLGATRGVRPIVVGFCLYAVGALLMLVAYRFGELSVLQPILGLSYALSLLMGFVWLGENVSVGRAIGVAAVVVGVALVARSSR